MVDGEKEEVGLDMHRRERHRQSRKARRKSLAAL